MRYVHEYYGSQQVVNKYLETCVCAITFLRMGTTSADNRWEIRLYCTGTRVK